jgi:hypothetical protein
VRKGSGKSGKFRRKTEEEPNNTLGFLGEGTAYLEASAASLDFLLNPSPLDAIIISPGKNNNQRNGAQ